MVWSLLLTGCSDFKLGPDESTEEAPVWVAAEDAFVQAPLAKVDILFVIDNTASMQEEQPALSVLLPEWFAGLDDLDLSWQVGVVTTDMTVEDAGWLRGAPYVVTSRTPERDEVFAEMIGVGTQGLAAEAGFAAAIAALDLATDGPNRGFRRADAALQVVIVSDNDDQSGPWLAGDPVEVFLDRLAAESAETGAEAQLSAITGPPSQNCSSTGASAQKAPTLNDAVSATNGVFVNICAIDLEPFSASLGALAVPGQAEFDLTSTPVPDSVRVQTDGEDAEGWSLRTPATIVFDTPPAAGTEITVRYLVEVAQ